MQKSDTNQKVMVVRRQPQSSTTLNRKYVRRPKKNSDAMVSIKKSPKVKHFNVSICDGSITKSQEQPIESAKMHPLQEAANAKMRERMGTNQNIASKVSANELKDQAIKKALASANSLNEEQQETQKKTKMHFGFGRVMLALGCAAVAVFAIVYFVNLNMPDISLKVAAMQTGINASYPSYVPRGYNISSITSEESQVTLDFVNSAGEGTFSLYEEKSSWDSNALLTNYVKEAFGENYNIVREQGLTIYISGNDAAWVNGGILYKIKTTTGTLTNKQIRSIATSL
ncbi:hypothetical protein IJJ36_01770 [Candidatus Saccharibacteria bacterium]|nr:hypothetical protein [Candidatus Saccharibacteria bacterium]